MRINPELLLIRKFNYLLEKYKDKDNIPKEEIKEIQKDIEDMIRQEAQYSKLYLYSAAEYINIEK